MNKEILKRYFSGLSNNWEKKQVLEYLEGDDLQVLDEYMLEQGGNAKGEMPAEESYKADFYRELSARIQEMENPAKVRRITYFRPLLKIAASILLVISAGAVLYLNMKLPSEKVGALLSTVKNNTKNLRRVDLKDGSSIWLTPGTTLTFNPKEFNDTARQVNLAGEAYFNVAHDKTRPFRVTAGGITTSVLGTTFNVEAYADEANVRVMLVTGQVRVNSATKTNLLLPGQMLEYSRKEETMKVNAVDVSDKQELLTSGKLIFENVALSDVLKRLSRVFNVDISAADPGILAHKQISGAYFRDIPESTLNRILFIHGLHYKKKGENRYVITE